jgi:hypothetical protein
VFASAADGEEIAFEVRNAKRGTPHLDGRLAPLEVKQKAKESGRKAR